MKKNLVLHLSALVMLIVLASACSEKTVYTNAIPADASGVAAINLKSLVEKTGLNDKENKEAMQKLTDAMKSGLNAATYQQLETIMKDPLKSGVDVTAPIYIFSAPSFNYVTVLAKVNDKDDLVKLLEVAQKEQLGSPITKADGYSFVKIDGQALLAFNESTLLIANCSHASQTEKIQEDIAALLKQTEEKSISSTPAFKKMQQMKGDLNLCASPSGLLSEYTEQLNYGLPKNIDLKDLKILCSLSFEAGKIEMQIENYTENTELKALLEKQAKSTRPIENTFLAYFPKSTLMMLSIGVNGEDFYNMLQENELFSKEFSFAKAAEVKNLFSAFQNDVTVGITNVTMSDASFLAYASVKNNAPLQALYEKRGELGLGHGEGIMKLSESEYIYKSRNTSIFFGVRNKQMYVTNDEVLYKNICKVVNPSAKDTKYASDLAGKHSAFVINMDAVLDLPVLKMMESFAGAEYATYRKLAGNISHLEATSNGDKTTISLQLKDNHVNSLKQIVNFIKEFAGLYQD